MGIFEIFNNLINTKQQLNMAMWWTPPPPNAREVIGGSVAHFVCTTTLLSTIIINTINISWFIRKLQ